MKDSRCMNINLEITSKSLLSFNLIPILSSILVYNETLKIITETYQLGRVEKNTGLDIKCMSVIYRPHLHITNILFIFSLQNGVSPLTFPRVMKNLLCSYK